MAARLVAWLAVIWELGESQVLQVAGGGPGLRWLIRKGVHLVVYGVLPGRLGWGNGLPPAV